MGKHHTAAFDAHLVRELRREDKTFSQLAAASKALVEPRNTPA